MSHRNTKTNTFGRVPAWFSQIALALLILAGLSGCAATSTGTDPQAKQVETYNGTPVLLKTVARASYFIGEYQLPVNEIREQTKPLAEKVAIAAVKKAKLDIVGPLTLFLPDWREQTSESETVTLGIGYPVTGQGQLVPQFQQTVEGPFKCLSVVMEPGSDNRAAWQKLYEIAAKQGLEVSGENRSVIRSANGGITVELQLGLR